jgi:glycosyltransferase involved in cell wall biosynthesis
LRRYVIKHKLESSVKLLGRVSDSALVALYQQATLYIQPSLSEGFGLPGLEAMAYNAPVLSADSSCLPEVYGDAAAYFDATSTSDLTKHIDALVIDSYALSKLAENGQKRLLHFNWKTTGEQTLAVYRVALRTNEA